MNPIRYAKFTFQHSWRLHWANWSAWAPVALVIGILAGLVTPWIFHGVANPEIMPVLGVGCGLIASVVIMVGWAVMDTLVGILHDILVTLEDHKPNLHATITNIWSLMGFSAMIIVIGLCMIFASDHLLVIIWGVVVCIVGAGLGLVFAVEHRETKKSNAG